jgi:hypothetical protein
VGQQKPQAILVAVADVFAHDTAQVHLVDRYQVINTTPLR